VLSKIPLDKLCAYSAEIGLKAIDLLVSTNGCPRRYGLVVAMGYRAATFPIMNPSRITQD